MGSFGIGREGIGRQTERSTVELWPITREMMRRPAREPDLTTTLLSFLRCYLSQRRPKTGESFRFTQDRERGNFLSTSLRL